MSTQSSRDRGQGLPSTSHGLTVCEDLRLMQRALRWDVSGELRAKTLRQIEAVLDNKQSSRKDILMAARVLGHLDEIDRRRERDEAESRSRDAKTVTSLLESLLSQSDGVDQAANVAQLTQQLKDSLDAQLASHSQGGVGGAYVTAGEQGGGSGLANVAPEKANPSGQVAQPDSPGKVLPEKANPVSQQSQKRSDE